MENNTNCLSIFKELEKSLPYEVLDLSRPKKSGREIKEKLEELRASKIFQAKSLSEKLLNLKESIGIDPNENKIHYETGMSYPIYSSSCLSEKNITDEQTMFPQEQMSKEVQESCYAYNNTSYDLMDFIYDIKCLNLVIGSIDEKKSYELPTRTFVKLGF